jgi:hypothetical protein
VTSFFIYVERRTYVSISARRKTRDAPHVRRFTAGIAFTAVIRWNGFCRRLAGRPASFPGPGLAAFTVLWMMELGYLDARSRRGLVLVHLGQPAAATTTLEG